MAITLPKGLGEIVYYLDTLSNLSAAIIIGQTTNGANLIVFTTTAQIIVTAPYAETLTPGSWTYRMKQGQASIA